jgi:sigma-B regulation protein RsbQ
MTYRHLLNADLRGDGPHTIVFGNGFSTTQHSWDDVLDVVPAGWRILRFDYVGSTPATTDRWIPERYATYAGHADDLLRLLEELQLENVLLVGHPMSGLVSAMAAVRAPHRFGHLLMIGASPCYREEEGYHGGFTGAQIADLLVRANADLAAWMGGFAPVVVGRDASPHHLTHYLETMLALRPDIATTMLRSIFASDYRSLLPSVHSTVTIVQGTDDVAVPVFVGQYLADHLPCRGYHEINAPGHLPHITHPQLIAPILAATCASFETGALRA